MRDSMPKVCLGSSVLWSHPGLLGTNSPGETGVSWNRSNRTSLHPQGRAIIPGSNGSDSRIAIKAYARLPSQSPGSDHASHQRWGSILSAFEFVEQGVTDRE